MSIIEKAISKLEKQKGKDSLLQSAVTAPAGKPAVAPELGPEVAANVVVNNVAASSDTNARKSTSTSPLSTAKPRAIHEIPLADLAEKGMITPQKPRSQIAEEYRTIKRPLLMNIEKKGAAIVENANLIMVTSAMPGEGKTFSAINLAMSVATEQDTTVLLVDADVTKASAAAVLGVPDDSPGLIDLLEDSSLSVSDVLIHTSVPKLRVLPAGRLHEHATELLASESMRRLMQELSSRYPDRVIIFDSPPLLLTSEAAVLANLMGQIVFVVSAEQSSQEAVSEAIQHLGEDKVIGLILNKARHSPFVKHGYGYGYSYGYGGARPSRAGDANDQS